MILVWSVFYKCTWAFLILIWLTTICCSLFIITSSIILSFTSLVLNYLSSSLWALRLSISFSLEIFSHLNAVCRNIAHIWLFLGFRSSKHIWLISGCWNEWTMIEINERTRSCIQISRVQVPIAYRGLIFDHKWLIHVLQWLNFFKFDYVFLLFTVRLIMWFFEFMILFSWRVRIDHHHRCNSVILKRQLLWLILIYIKFLNWTIIRDVWWILVIKLSWLLVLYRIVIINCSLGYRTSAFIQIHSNLRIILIDCVNIELMSLVYNVNSIFISDLLVVVSAWFWNCRRFMENTLV